MRFSQILFALFSNAQLHSIRNNCAYPFRDFCNSDVICMYRQNVSCVKVNGLPFTYGEFGVSRSLEKCSMSSTRDTAASSGHSGNTIRDSILRAFAEARKVSPARFHRRYRVTSSLPRLSAAIRIPAIKRTSDPGVDAISISRRAREESLYTLAREVARRRDGTRKFDLLLMRQLRGIMTMFDPVGN